MIGSVLKSLDVLELFSSTEPTLTLSEIARRLGLPKSTAFNLLATLASRNYITRVEGEKYALGTAIMPLTQAVWTNVQLRDRAAPLLRNVADASRESVYLTAREGEQCLYIYAVESPRRLLARTAVGDRMPMHCTSVGKAMLAFMPAQEVDEVIQRAGLPSATEHTITSRERLLEELDLTRLRGYSVDREENELGVYCVGAAILDANGSATGSCSISGSDPEIVQGRREELATLLLTAAEEISRRLGYMPKKPRAYAS